MVKESPNANTWIQVFKMQRMFWVPVKEPGRADSAQMSPMRVRRVWTGNECLVSFRGRCIPQRWICPGENPQLSERVLHGLRHPRTQPIGLRPTNILKNSNWGFESSRVLEFNNILLNIRLGRVAGLRECCFFSGSNPILDYWYNETVTHPRKTAVQKAV